MESSFPPSWRRQCSDWESAGCTRVCSGRPGVPEEGSETAASRTGGTSPRTPRDFSTAADPDGNTAREGWKVGRPETTDRGRTGGVGSTAGDDAGTRSRLSDRGNTGGSGSALGQTNQNWTETSSWPISAQLLERRNISHTRAGSKETSVQLICERGENPDARAEVTDAEASRDRHWRLAASPELSW